VYGCKTWTFNLREENRLKNIVLKRILGPSREEVTGGLGKLHREELHNLYSSPNRFIIRKIKLRRMR
jgi:hypothetical protein